MLTCWPHSHWALTCWWSDIKCTWVCGDIAKHIGIMQFLRNTHILYGGEALLAKEFIAIHEVDIVFSFCSTSNYDLHIGTRAFLRNQRKKPAHWETLRLQLKLNIWCWAKVHLLWCAWGHQMFQFCQTSDTLTRGTHMRLIKPQLALQQHFSEGSALLIQSHPKVFSAVCLCVRNCPPPFFCLWCQVQCKLRREAALQSL